MTKVDRADNRLNRGVTAMPLSAAAMMSLATIRLVATGPNGTQVGTGFLYQFKVPSIERPDAAVHLIITNKHVAAAAHLVEFTLTWLRPGAELTEGVIEEDDQHITHRVAMAGRLFPHPDPAVDLCAFAIDDVVSAGPPDRKVRLLAISASWHLPPEEAAEVRPIETAVMIGYPNGLWDETNNRPIARRAMTASHPLQRWNGARQFVIDAACFPGSSGSPVFLYEDGAIRQPGGAVGIGFRARLLGVLFAGPLFTAEGRMEQRAIPTGLQEVPVHDQMMNLGFVVHADAILELRPLIVARLALDGHHVQDEAIEAT
jgi:hypothetical protein